MLRETCELIFVTSLGGTRTVRVPDPQTTVASNILNTAANNIISANPFDETVGNLVSLKRADRVTVNRISLI